MSKSEKSSQKKEKPNKRNNLVYIVPLVIILLAAYFYLTTEKKTYNVPIRQGKKVNGYTNFNFHKHGELTFTDSKGEVKSLIDIEIADDDIERENGLMYRSEMKENQGMLFIFDREAIQSFWMRNTILPLDMIFIDKNFKIVTIRKNTEPFNDKISYTSTEPALYVLEVNAGYADKYGINVGDKIVWRRM